MRERSLFHAAVLLGVLALAVAAPALADITTPGAGATVRGDVTINEDTGATKPFFCSDSDTGSAISVARLSDAVVVHSVSKNGTGGLSTVWNTHGAPIGDYNLKSTAVNKDNLCNPSTSIVRSNFNVHLENNSNASYTGPRIAAMLSPIEASARLRDEKTGRAIDGRTITFSFDGRQAGTCSTDFNGVCSTTILIVALPGQHTLGVSFGGDCCWTASNSSVDFTVTLPI
ncbi:MAG: hypothetical protein ABR548_11505 [Actinomycetota bacterium]|nr:hypothetical protein [Actinomycetota bacterium]